MLREQMDNRLLIEANMHSGITPVSLQDMPIFGGIRTDVLRFLLDRVSFVSVTKGGLYFREGDKGSSLYVLEKGTVSVFKQWHGYKYELDVLRRGDCFGEMALTDLFPRSAAVQALEDTAAIEITNNVLFDVYGKDLEQFALIQMNIARELSRRLRRAGQCMIAACRT
jgi:CRP-like cAMP-binding protein